MQIGKKYNWNDCSSVMFTAVHIHACKWVLMRVSPDTTVQSNFFGITSHFVVISYNMNAESRKSKTLHLALSSPPNLVSWCMNKQLFLIILSLSVGWPRGCEYPHCSLTTKSDHICALWWSQVYLAIISSSSQSRLWLQLHNFHRPRPEPTSKAPATKRSPTSLFPIHQVGGR